MTFEQTDFGITIDANGATTEDVYEHVKHLLRRPILKEPYGVIRMDGNIA